MTIGNVFDKFYKRLLIATALWLLFWPLLWFIKIGEITGPKAWFWIVGAVNYPVVAVVYVLLDNLLKSFGLKSFWIFVGAVLLIVLCMPFYYERIGFALGVSIEARYL